MTFGSVISLIAIVGTVAYLVFRVTEGWSALRADRAIGE
jgi:flagellar biogenesis protein FliO